MCLQCLHFVAGYLTLFVWNPEVRGEKKKENGLSKCWTVVKRTVVYVESINEIIKIDRSNETFLALLSCGVALFSMF